MIHEPLTGSVACTFTLTKLMELSTASASAWQYNISMKM